MNDNDQPVEPPVIPADPFPAPLPSQKPKPLSWWLQKLFVCNPFYLVSAALLLYGCYRTSIDAPIFNAETARLFFNFGSVQVYEILLVVTAIFLARRAIWYDSTLLVGLENLLVFVPFVLISQAALTGRTMGTVMCLIAAMTAVIRLGSLRRFFRELNLPRELLVAGGVLLVLNVGLALVYRGYGEHMNAASLDSGPAHAMNLNVWMFVLPAALALANAVPQSKPANDLLPQHRWLPIGLFSLWIIVTGVHLYSLGYVYQFVFSYDQAIPTGWVMAWTVYHLVDRNFKTLPYPLKEALMCSPIGVALLALASGDKMFLALSASNIVAYAVVCRDKGSRRFARHLLFGSVLMSLAGMPAGWLRAMGGLTAGEMATFGGMAYLMLWIIRSREPKLAILGSFIVGAGTLFVFGDSMNVIHLAFQGAFAFLLLHSLRWHDSQHEGAKMVRVLACGAWLVESLVWVNVEESKFWMPCIPAGIVLGSYLVVRSLRKKWDHPVIPITSTLVLLSGPGNALGSTVQSMPAGLLAVIGSFLLFGGGTVIALTRHLWHRHEPTADMPSAQDGRRPSK